MPSYLDLMTRFPRPAAPVYGAAPLTPTFFEPDLPMPAFLGAPTPSLGGQGMDLFSPPAFDQPLGLAGLGPPPGRLRQTQQAAGAPAQPGAPALPTMGGGAIEDAIDAAAAGDTNLALAMKLAVYLESGGDANAVGDDGQSHGYYQIHQPAHGRNITPQQSRDPHAATRYMLPQFKAAMARVDPTLWRTNPMQAAALTAYYAERPASMYDAGRVQQAWSRASAPRQQPAAGSDLTPNQFGGELDAATAASACGPAAAIAFARANGRNPTLPEAVALARQVGWDPSRGMAGPQSQVALLQRMGIAARLEQGVDWARVAQAVQAGKPVIIDTPEHYWVAERYDPTSGRFYFGNSARVLKATGGQAWLTPQQMAAIHRPRSTIYYGT